MLGDTPLPAALFSPTPFAGFPLQGRAALSPLARAFHRRFRDDADLYCEIIPHCRIWFGSTNHSDSTACVLDSSSTPPTSNGLALRLRHLTRDSLPSRSSISEHDTFFRLGCRHSRGSAWTQYRSCTNGSENRLSPDNYRVLGYL